MQEIDFLHECKTSPPCGILLHPPTLSSKCGRRGADKEIAQMLSILNSYKPRVIGLDLFRDKSNSADAELAPVWRENPNLIGVEVALNPKQSFNVKPPPELPPERVGFADTIVDPDGKLRRSLIASKTYTGELKYSLSLRLAQFYLHEQGIEFAHGSRSYPQPFRTISLRDILIIKLILIGFAIAS
ncbi:MAG: CHASE2 domain-containing protein [Nostoc sp.]|uniref:CHASE2 domain-containing protein n=1 Tax=unclassified Nostoc TaxID=2593658 RepID=UPI0025FBC61B|nr:CHASE2 domain-containing protein [Nostoc sp. NMS9]